MHKPPQRAVIAAECDRKIETWTRTSAYATKRITAAEEKSDCFTADRTGGHIRRRNCAKAVIADRNSRKSIEGAIANPAVGRKKNRRNTIDGDAQRNPCRLNPQATSRSAAADCHTLRS